MNKRILKVLPDKEFITFTIQLVNKYAETVDDLLKEVNSKIYSLRLKRDPKNKTIHITYDWAIEELRAFSRKVQVQDIGYGASYHRKYWNLMIEGLDNIDEINTDENLIVYRDNPSHMYSSEKSVIDNLIAYWDWLNDKIYNADQAIFNKIGNIQHNLGVIIDSYENTEYEVYVDGTKTGRVITIYV